MQIFRYHFFPFPFFLNKFLIVNNSYLRVLRYIYTCEDSKDAAFRLWQGYLPLASSLRCLCNATFEQGSGTETG